MPTGPGNPGGPGGPIEKPTKDPKDPKDDPNQKPDPVDFPDQVFQVAGKATQFIGLAVTVFNASAQKAHDDLVKQKVQPLPPQPQAAFVTGTLGPGDNATLGIWPTWVAPNSPQMAIRLKTLRTLNYLEKGEDFAFAGAPWVITKKVKDLVDAQRASDPSVSIRSYDLFFNQLLPTSGNIVVIIKGNKGIDFTLTVTFAFAVVNGMVSVSPPQVDLEKDTSLLDFFSVLSGLFGINGFSFLLLDIAGVGAPSIPGIDNPFPAKQLVTGKQKLDYHYSRITISQWAGVVAGGVYTLDARTPKASISGKTSIDFHLEDEPPAGSFRVVTDDLLAPFSKILWSTTDKTVKILNQGSLSAAIQFPIPPTTSTPVHHSFRVDVTDLEGMTAGAQTTVSVMKLKTPAKQLPDKNDPGTHKGAGGAQ